MVSLALGLAGAATGAAIGGTFLGVSAMSVGWAVGSTIGALISAPDMPDVYGPRLQDLRVQTSTRGAPIPKVYGTSRLAGNVIWSSGIKETVHVQEVGGKGPPTQTQTTYTYSCSFAVGLSEGEITGIRRIWADSILIYNKGDTATADELAVSNQVGITIYTGSETQEPDPLMEADKGVGNVPAYRGLAYVVFEDLQLEKYGNRIPNITCEVVESGQENFSLVKTATYNLDGYASGYTTSALFMDSNATMTIFSATTAIWTRGPVEIREITRDGIQTLKAATFTRPAGAIFLDGWADSPCCVYSNGLGTIYVFDNTGNLVHVASGTGLIANGQNGQYYQRDSEKWVLRENYSSTTVMSVKTGSAALAYYSTPASPTGQLHTMFPALGFIYGFTLSKQFVCFDYNFNVIWSIDMSSSGIGTITPFVGGSDVIIREYNPTTALIKWSLGYWLVNSSGYSYLGNVSANTTYEEHGGHHFLNGNFYYCKAQQNQLDVIQFKSTIGLFSVSLSSVISELCNKVELINISTSAISGYIYGYVRTQRMTAAAAIAPLLDTYNITAAESDYQLKFTPRIGAPSGTIGGSELAAHRSGTAPDPLKTTRTDDTQLPRKITVTYTDFDGDYQPGVQQAQRVKVDG